MKTQSPPKTEKKGLTLRESRLKIKKKNDSVEKK